MPQIDLFILKFSSDVIDCSFFSQFIPHNKTVIHNPEMFRNNQLGAISFKYRGLTIELLQMCEN